MSQPVTFGPFCRATTEGNLRSNNGRVDRGTDQYKRLSSERLRALDALLDEQLEQYTDAGSKGKGRLRTDTSKFSLKQWTGRLVLSLLCLLLPFFVLIRTSIFAYTAYALNGWIALVLGIAATVALLLLYGLYITFRFKGTIKINRFLIRGVVALVVAYCCYGLIYLSGMNVKSEEIRSYYHSLHPILRVTIATATLADSDLVITDMQRTADDYTAMGLTPRQRSLHYKQSTGYVHAVDLRTIGRPAWKNWLTRKTLDVLGYKTIRHVGTADHLHVALPLND